MKNECWIEDQNDPDNWIVIPEFNIFPIDVKFEGFAYPIIGALNKDFQFLSPMRETLTNVRREARKRFSTLAALRAAAAQVEPKILEFAADEHKPLGISADEAFAWRYGYLLRDIRLAIQTRRGKRSETAAIAARIASTLSAMVGATSLSDTQVKKIRSEQGRRGAAGKLANDKNGKQAAKQNVRECWEAWQQKPEPYKSKSAFARAMLDKYGELGSQRVIERWCKEWESELS